MSGAATRREAIAGLARARRKAKPVRAAAKPAAPHRLKAKAASPSLVSLAWTTVRAPVPHTARAHAKAKAPKISYEILRDGHVLARTTHPRYSDHRVKPSHRYTYAVRAIAGHTAGPRTRWVAVRTPAAPKPVARPAPAAPAPAQEVMSTAMVERLFWRAGFGPTNADRFAWTGQPPSALVEHFLTAAYALSPTSTPPTQSGQPINPLSSDQELQMEWLDRMQRTTNPLTERLNFFWHRHWAVSKDSGIPPQFLLTYRDRLRKYSDLAANPAASFHDLALEMTTQDAAMSMYLTGYLNTKSAPNENYAREFMELFCLGVTNAAGQPNYSQTDVHQLARAFTGWALNQSTGAVSFTASRYDAGTKTILGQTGAFDASAAVGIVLSQPSHAPFLVTKLWNEFIRTPIPADALSWLSAAYVDSGYQIAPLVRGILSHPLIFESIDEPNLIKPPVVYAVGVLRTLGAPLKDTVQTGALDAMGQQPYHPPNVAGWEGGLSWLNTTSAVARFQYAVTCQNLLPAIADVPGETALAAYDRAFELAGRPWVSSATQVDLLQWATAAPVATAARRRERVAALAAFMLGGPDGQVM